LKNRHILHVAELNIAVLLISTSGVLGRYISMPPEITIWWRCLFGALLLGAFCYYKKIDLVLNIKKDWKTFLISSLFLGAHWVTYFYALKFSNVAIAMLSLFTYPVITALLEPLFFKQKLNKINVFLGLVILIGVYFLTPDLDLENNLTLGVLFGLISSVFYAIRNILTKKHTASYHGSMVMFYQLTIVTLVLWPVLFIEHTGPSYSDWQALVALALITTALGHTLFVLSFRHFSISTASVMSSVQPVYGIIFGILFLSEIPSFTTLIGGVLIVITVIIEALYSKNKR